MDLSATYIDKTMDTGPQSNTAKIWNLSSVWTNLDDLDKSLNRYSSLSLQWISETYNTSMKLLIQAHNQIQPEFGICLLFGQIGRFGQNFESLLLTQFAMDLSETYIDETMDIDPQSNTARIWNLSSLPRLCPNLSKSGITTPHLSFQWISLKLVSMKLWIIGPQSNMARIWHWQFVLCFLILIS